MKNKIFFFFNFAFFILHSAFTQAANYYWVGGTGNWSNYTVHWATTSGGNVFHVQVPTSFDDVHFDANSFTALGQIVTNDTTIAYCRDMDWTGATNNPTFEAANINIELKIFGSLTLNPIVNFSFNGHLTFTSFNPGKTIQTFSRVLQCPIEFNGAGGEWTLLDSLTTTKTVTLTYGTVRTNNNNIGCNIFNSYNNNARALYLGTSTVRLTYGPANWSWYVSSSLIIDADSSIIRLKDNGTFHALGHAYNIIQWDSTGSSSTSNVLAHDSLRINKVISLNSGVNSTLRIEYLGTSRIDSIIAMGSLNIRFGGSNFFKSVFVNRNFFYDNDVADSIINMTVNGNATFFYNYGNGNHYLHAFTVHGNLTISPGDWLYPNLQTFDSCYVGGNATILSANNQMGIFTMTPGKTLTLKNDSTQYIDSLSATGNPGFPIQVISSDLGHAANVVIQKDLCTNYLYIHAVHATSPGFLFVGGNSNDVANNSGWIFSNCITGMENNYDASLSIFPNPATNQFTIYDLQSTILNVEIYNMVGGKVLDQKPTANSQQQVINVSELNPGIYFVKVKAEQQEYVAKFVKQ
jgi:hypothetical protein